MNYKVLLVKTNKFTYVTAKHIIETPVKTNLKNTQSIKRQGQLYKIDIFYSATNCDLQKF